MAQERISGKKARLINIKYFTINVFKANENNDQLQAK